MTETVVQQNVETYIPSYNADDTRSFDELLNDKWNDFKVITQNISRLISKKYENLKKLNIIITGRSGSGKSTLINNLFRGKLAKTGYGRPVTRSIRMIQKENVPLIIYDTPGMELGKKQQVKLKKDIFDLIERCAETDDVSQAIHCILYCVSCSLLRFESEEELFINQFTNDKRLGNIPVILVLTQCYDEDDTSKMFNELNSMNLNVKQIVPVVSEPKIFKAFGKEFVSPRKGLDLLIEVIENFLPNILKETLHNVQIASIKLKKAASLKAIEVATTAALLAGAAPIPFSDCIALIPIEVTMLTSITIIYGVEIPTGLITDILASTIGCGSATLFGKKAVANLLKMIPGVGSIIGSFISGGIAVTITTALGITYIQIIESLYKHEFRYNSMSHDELYSNISTLFQENLTNSFQQNTS